MPTQNELPKLPPGYTLVDPALSPDANIPPLPPGYSFDEATAERLRQAQPAGGQFPRAGHERIPGQGLPGAPNYQGPVDIPRPLAAGESRIGLATQLNLIEDDGTKKRILAESLFPGDPTGINRVGFIEGVPVYVNSQGVLQRAVGPVAGLTGSVTANAPEIAGGIAGSFFGGPGGAIAGSTIGATGGRAWKRVLSNLAFDEPQTVAQNAFDLGQEALSNVAGAKVGQLSARFLDRSRVVDFTSRQQQKAEATRQYIKDRTGVDLDLALASGDRKLIALREYAGKFPGRAADLVQAHDEIMQGQFNTATERVLNMVAKAEPEEVSGGKAMSAAQHVMSMTKKDIQQQVGPLYRQAYETATEIDHPSITQLLELKDVRDAVAKSRYTIALENRGTPKAIDRDPRTGEPMLVDANEPLSLEVLDLTKQHLDDRVEELAAKGDLRTSVALAGVRDDIKEFLDNVSTRTVRARNPKDADKVISLYKQARATYGRLYEEKMTPLENGAIGVLARMHPANARLAASVLQQSSVGPQQIAILKAGLSRSDPEAYKGLVRLYLQQEWDEAQKISQSGDVINPAGKFLQRVFRTPAQRDRMIAMLPPKTAEVLEDVMLAAEHLAKTPIGSSRQPGPTTARDILLTEQLKGRAFSVIRWLRSPIQTAKESAEQRVLESGIEELTEALIDPTKRAQLKQIARMKPSTQQLFLLAGMLGGQSLNTSGSSDATDIPAAMVGPQP